MKLVFGKELSADDKLLITRISLECGIMQDTARLLLYRNIDSVEKAKAFLNPSKAGFYNPMLLSGMEEAVQRINRAKQNCESVLIFGDYDVDGICASAVLHNALNDFGISAKVVIPEREEGYGINVQKVLKMHAENHIDLLISVDCGISDHDAVEQLKSAGIDVVVTDHHEAPEILPECIRIDPKMKECSYPFKGLSGAGVAYKLACALIGEKADEYLDFVALSTVADSMDLLDENRCIVTEGLKIFNSEKLRPQFKYLISDNKQVTASTFAYSIAPRINAGGRMGDANLSLKLFLSKKDSEIFDITSTLCSYNVARQVECDNIYRQAKKMIKDSGAYKNRVILVANDSWQTGFIGIVAAKLVEDFSRPVIVFAGHEGYFKGSARSIDGVNIHDAISSVKDYLIGFGGHSQAAGISVSKENFEKVNVLINQYARQNFPKQDYEKKVYVDWEIRKNISIQFAREIDMLEPFGVGNRRPVFSVKANSVYSEPLKLGSQHYSFKINSVEFLDFNGEKNVETLMLPTQKDIIFELNLSTFRNKESLKGYVKGINLDINNLSASSLHIFEKQLLSLKKDVNIDLIRVSSIDEIACDGSELYVLSDINNLDNYPQLSGLPVNVFEIMSKGGPCIVISPNQVIEDYDKIIYLDNPISLLDFNGENLLIDGLNGFNWIDNLSLDRTDFSRLFSFFRSLTGKNFKSATDLYFNSQTSENAYQFIFALTVFTELNIFECKNGKLQYNYQVKNPLTNSKVYSKIYMLKG